MKTDVCNAPVALTSQQALDDWNAMIRAFLAHGTDAAPRLGAVLEAEPDFALGHATKGIFSLLMGRRELV
ncbi:MAG: tetratricopeptide repeat protein, partial [Pseudomonadota bacterium]